MIPFISRQITKYLRCDFENKIWEDRIYLITIDSMIKHFFKLSIFLINAWLKKILFDTSLINSVSNSKSIIANRKYLTEFLEIKRKMNSRKIEYNLKRKEYAYFSNWIWPKLGVIFEEINIMSFSDKIVNIE